MDNFTIDMVKVNDELFFCKKDLMNYLIACEKAHTTKEVVDFIQALRQTLSNTKTV